MKKYRLRIGTKHKKLMPVEALFRCNKSHFHSKKGYDRKENKKILKKEIDID